ncbi:hypothetical protein [Gynuella sp.]|uniref:hypothetical protein n=1 Tax=Gynuella sp. TaxID=2969146 RepID=UPI003D0D4A00
MGAVKIYMVSAAVIFGMFLFWYRPVSQMPQDQILRNNSKETSSPSKPSPNSTIAFTSTIQDQAHSSPAPRQNPTITETESPEPQPIPADPNSTDPYLPATGEHADEVNLAVTPCTDSCAGAETITVQADGYFAGQVNAKGLRERALLDGAIDPNADLGIPLTDQSDTPPPPTGLGEYIVIDDL